MSIIDDATHGRSACFASLSILFLLLDLFPMSVDDECFRIIDMEYNNNVSVRIAAESSIVPVLGISLIL